MTKLRFQTFYDFIKADFKTLRVGGYLMVPAETAGTSGRVSLT